jgi:hypothetical protein
MLRWAGAREFPPASGSYLPSTYLDR